MNAGFYTSLLSEVASWGFTVLAVDHPGEAPYLSVPKPYGDADGGVKGWDIYMPYSDALILEMYEYRLGDMLALLAPSSSADANSSDEGGFPALVKQYGSYFNTEKYAVLGHSIGAAQGTGAMDRLDSIVAGFNIDGGLFGDSVNASLHGRPYFMTMNPNHFAQDPDTWPRFAERYASEAKANGGWLDWTTVKGSAHLAFSDLSLWVELLPTIENATQKVDLGNVTGRRMDKLLKAYVGAFLGWVADGEYDGGLLDGEVEEWPEVVFDAKVRAGGNGNGTSALEL